MRIIYFEIKKLVNLKLIFFLIILNILLYYMYIRPYTDDFNRSRPKSDQYKLFVEMEQLYGSAMDAEEFKDFKVYYEERTKEADVYIKTDDEFAKRGITTYTQFRDRDIDIYKVDSLHHYAIFDIKSVDFFWELPEREQVIMLFDYYQDQYALSKKDSQDYKTSIFYYFIFNNYNRFIKNVTITTLFNILLLLSTLFQKDNVLKLKYIQYTSKVGRTLFMKKVAAGLITSFLLVTVLLTVFFSIYFRNDISMFLKSTINSAFNPSQSWYNIRFIHYIVLTIAAIYIISFLFTILSMLISNRINNYIILMGAQLVVFLLLWKVIEKYLDLLIDIRLPQMLMPSCFMFFTITIVTVLIIKYKKEKALDIIY